MSGPYEDFLATTTTSAAGPQGSAATAASAVPFWGDNPNAWDKVTIAGVELPGICDVTGSVKMKVDHKAVPGTHGHKQTFIGYEPAKVKVKVQLWTGEHLQAYQSLVKKARPRDKISPVDIAHPNCSIYGITSVKVLEMGFLQRSGDVYTSEIECVENWTPQRSKQAKVSSSSNSLDKFTNEITPRVDQKNAAKPSTQNASFSPANASFPP